MDDRLTDCIRSNGDRDFTLYEPRLWKRILNWIIRILK